MFKSLKYLMVGVMGLSTMGFVACDDLDDDYTHYPSDAWTGNRAYIKYQHLGQSTYEFEMMHIEDEGVSGDTDVKVPFSVGLVKALDKDAVVAFDVTSVGLPEGVVTVGENNTVVIPAKQTLVPVELKVNTDWSFVKPEAMDFTINVRLKECKAGNSDIALAESFAIKVGIRKHKMVSYVDYIPNEKPAEPVITGSNKWTPTCTPAEDLSNPWYYCYQIANGKTNDYFFLESPFLAFNIDMGNTHEITGLKYLCGFGAPYAPREMKVFTSMDGAHWIPVTGDDTRASITPGNEMYLKFSKAIITRYIMVQAWGENVLCSEMYFYGK